MFSCTSHEKPVVGHWIGMFLKFCLLNSVSVHHGVFGRVNTSHHTPTWETRVADITLGTEDQNQKQKENKHWAFPKKTAGGDRNMTMSRWRLWCWLRPLHLFITLTCWAKQAVKEATIRCFLIVSGLNYSLLSDFWLSKVTLSSIFAPAALTFEHFLLQVTDRSWEWVWRTAWFLPARLHQSR